VTSYCQSFVYTCTAMAGQCEEYLGRATMMITMPMSPDPIPIPGTCKVEDRHVSLHFPYTDINFDYAEIPTEHKPCKVKLRGDGKELSLYIRYIPELSMYSGVGHEEEKAQPVLYFYYGQPDNAILKSA